MRSFKISKMGALPLSLLVVITMIISANVSYGYDFNVWFDNRTSQYLAKEDGYFFILSVSPSYDGELNNVDYITAVNTDPDLYCDYDTYYFEIIFQGNNVLEIISYNKYTGQGGVYAVTFHYDDGSTLTDYMGSIAPRKKPIPIPDNLNVDFTSGYTTPTFTFDSVDDTTVDNYRHALYAEPYRDRRLAIYNTTDPENDPFIYYIGAPGGTGEPLQVGGIYILRAEAWDYDTGSGNSYYRSFNYLTFLVPDPNIHYKCEYIRLMIDQSAMPEGIKKSLIAKITTCRENNINSFIFEVSALSGYKISRWFGDILIQCATGVLEKP
jgi:hypothetical protein